MLVYRTALEIHGVAAPPDEKARYDLDSIIVDPAGTIAACNGYQFLRMTATANEPDLFTEERLGAQAGEVLDHPVTIPADIVKAFLAASKRKRKKGQREQQILIAVTEGRVTLATADGKTKRTFLIETDAARIPPLNRTIPTGTPVGHMTLGVDEVLQVCTTLQRCGVLSFECLYFAPEAPLRILGETFIDNAALRVDGALMPRRPTEATTFEQVAPVPVDTETGEFLDEPAGEKGKAS